MYVRHGFGDTSHVRSRGEEAGHKARRWVLERTHSWFNCFRRILVRWEKAWESALGLLHLVGAVVTDRAARLLGWALR